MDFSQINMQEEKEMTLLIRYIGEQDYAFTPGHIYEARKLSADEYNNDSFSIYDDTEDFYVYSGNFIRSNFQLVEVV